MVWETSSPQTFTRRLYQAIDTAYRTNDPLGKLQGMFRFRQKGSRVVAERIEVIATIIEHKVYKSQTIIVPVSLAEILGIMIEESLDEGKFEIAALNTDAYNILDKWCKNFNFSYTKNPLVIKRNGESNGGEPSTEGNNTEQRECEVVRGDARKLFVLDSESTAGELQGSSD